MTPEQIEAKAKEIGARNYHPIGTFIPGVNTGGITIKQELMRTAIGALIGNDWVSILSVKERQDIKIELCLQMTTALLLEMAKQELEVGNE
jgi:hypothetical protein